MPVYRLGNTLVFPPAEKAERSGLLAVGGDLSPERLLLAYASGIFPWFVEDGMPHWFSPDPRGVLVPDHLQVHRSLARRLRSGRFRVTMDQAFPEVIRACAAMPREGQDGTWISPEMVEAYEALHRLGFAHSVEAWREGRLVGGLYGVSLGKVFFGESMFALEADASKVALVALVRQVARWGMELVDCQVRTAHLESLGAELWPRARYLQVLAACLRAPTRRGAWTLDADLPGQTA